MIDPFIYSIREKKIAHLMTNGLPVMFEGGHRIGDAAKISEVPDLDDPVVTPGHNEGIRRVPI
jgi:hypothetical protein